MRVPETNFLVLSWDEPNEQTVQALEASAQSLGFSDGAGFVALNGYQGNLAQLIHLADPWSVVAIDDKSIEYLACAFGDESLQLAPDNSLVVRGYRLVAVPGFAQCFDDIAVKRVAWERLKAARHPVIAW